MALSFSETFCFYTGESEFPDPDVKDYGLFPIDDSSLFGNGIAMEPGPLDDPFRSEPKVFTNANGGSALFLERSMVGNFLVGFNSSFSELYYLRQFKRGKIYICLGLPGWQATPSAHYDKSNLVAYMR
jgi:hypothetical protein